MCHVYIFDAMKWINRVARRDAPIWNVCGLVQKKIDMILITLKRIDSESVFELLKFLKYFCSGKFRMKLYFHCFEHPLPCFSVVILIAYQKIC